MYRIDRWVIWRSASGNGSLGVCVELVEGVLEGVELLTGFGEFAGGGEALVVGEVTAGFGDEGVDVGWRLLRGGVLRVDAHSAVLVRS